MSSSKPAWRRRVGRVSVYQRGERYWIYYRQGRQFRYPVGTDRAEALALGAKVNAQLAEGVPTLLSFQPIAIDALVRKWLEHHEQIRRSSLATTQRYRTAVAHLVHYIQSTRGSLRADRLDASLTEGFVRYLRATPVSPNGHKNTPKRTMRDKKVVFVLESCRSLLNFAREQRHLPAYSPNPFAGLSIDRMRIEDAKPVRPFTPEQEIEFFKACDDWQFRVFFLLAFTGLRVGELTHLLVDSDVRLDENLVRIGNKPGLHWQVKTRNLRDVPVLPEVGQVLRACIHGRQSGPVILRRRFAEGPEVPSLAGRSIVDLEEEVRRRVRSAEEQSAVLTRAQVARIGRSVWRDAGAVKETTVRVEFMSVTKRIGMEYLTCPKDLRHLFATSLQAAGVDPLIRRDIMGHTSLDMTAHYTHTQNATRQRELTRLAEIRGGALQMASGRC